MKLLKTKTKTKTSIKLIGKDISFAELIIWLENETVYIDDIGFDGIINYFPSEGDEYALAFYNLYNNNIVLALHLLNIYGLAIEGKMNKNEFTFVKQ